MIPRVPRTAPPRLLSSRLAALALLALACGGSETPADSPLADAPPAAAAEPFQPTTSTAPVFVEKAAETGLDFVHFNGMSGELYTFEHMSAGVALFDYDRDGDLDVYFNQGHMLGPGKTIAEATFPPPPGPVVDRLYRNDLETADDGSRRMRFTDVTEESGIVADGYGMGVAVGDYDNDGWPDLFVATWGSPNQLWRNNGDLTFSEVAADAGLIETRWSIPVAFLDYDRDGWLDLFVVNYLDYSYSVHKECNNDLGMRDYCGPVSYRPVPDVLYRNLGDGTFEDVSDGLGDGSQRGSGMGVSTGDFNDDGWLDLYVANDELPNYLWINAGDGTFREEALMSGAAVNAQGDAEAGMGVAVGDLDGDGDEDIFVAHLDQETNTLYANVGGGIFEDRTNEAKLGSPSWALTGFGPGFLDYDNDGLLDLFVSNGAVQSVRHQLLAGDPYPLHLTNSLYRNQGNGSFLDISASAGPAFQISSVSRGTAFGDLDNDGDTDVVMLNNAGPAHLFVNQVGQNNDWLGLQLISASGPGSNGLGRNGLGAWVEALLPGGVTLGRRVRTDGSYASAHDPRVLFGLGGSQLIERVRVTWVDGRIEEWDPPPTGQYTTLRQGSGTAAGNLPR